MLTLFSISVPNMIFYQYMLDNEIRVDMINALNT